MRNVRRLVVVAAAVLIPLASTAPAHGATPPAPKPRPICVVHSNASQVESGNGPTQESSIADIVQVECRPIYSQQTVTIDATQLSNACHGTLTWINSSLTLATRGPQFTVTLDNDGNAIAAVFGGPSCAPSRNRISASLNAPPFTTAATTFTILPPRNTPPGVTANPSSEVEEGVYSSVATVVQVEFPSVQAEKFVTIKSDELFARCGGALLWVGPNHSFNVTGPEVTHVQLDNNGNAFAVVFAGRVGPGSDSCASGTSTITADLETVPYTTYVGSFTILSPRPTV